MQKYNKSLTHKLSKNKNISSDFAKAESKVEFVALLKKHFTELEIEEDLFEFVVNQNYDFMKSLQKKGKLFSENIMQEKLKMAKKTGKIKYMEELKNQKPDPEILEIQKRLIAEEMLKDKEWDERQAKNKKTSETSETSEIEKMSETSENKEETKE